MSNTPIDRRMKEQYEFRTRYYLPRRTYTVLRVDGKAFHTLCKKSGLRKPFDPFLISTMDNTAIKLCKEIQGTRFAFVQSDEISLLLTDFETPTTDAWFDGNIQKMVSVSASIAGVTFSRIFEREAFFDSRVFTIPDPIEVENYFIWRQQDATRNAISMIARSHYSHKECLNKNSNDMQEMIHRAGDNFNNYTAREKRGGIVVKVPDIFSKMEWNVEDPPIFTQEREFLRNLIPKVWENDQP